MTAPDALREALRAELTPRIEALHRFVERRFAELSAELHASVQLADMSEEKLSRELALVHERIAGLVAAPAAASRNSGVELEAVVLATEAAANTIMEAAEAIQQWIEGGERDSHTIRSLAARVSTIFEACSFQDVTGQRIRRAIQHLQQVEATLERVMPRGQPLPTKPRLAIPNSLHTVPPSAATGNDLAQADIDALLNR